MRDKWKQYVAVTVLGLLIAAFFLLVLRRAWLSDDAYITFRTVDNLANGYRLTWNTIERVQVYTHPLWMFTLSLFYILTDEIYFTSMLVSLGISTLVVVLLSWKIASSRISAIVGLLILGLSNAYIDYATSGLENPLTHLLLVLFFIIYFRQKTSLLRIFLLSMIASLAGFNRIDSLLFYIPALLLELWDIRSWKALFISAVGQTPLILWELFSLFYYGFPFPNTAYAKLNTGIPAGELAKQGIYYLINSIQRDLITLIAVLAGLIIAFFTMKRRYIPLAAGMILYLGYIIKIGGDFMSGRFLTAPLLCAVIILTQVDFSRLKPHIMASVVMILVILGSIAAVPTVLAGKPEQIAIVDEHGISDERLWYYPDFSLRETYSQLDPPHTLGRIRGVKARVESNNDLYAIAINNTGVYGYYAGPSVYIIDNYALSDPLLARLPAIRTTKWRIGHFQRDVPAEYISTIYQLEQLGDPNLAAYYEKLTLLTQGKLSDPARIAEIWNFNTGRYDHLLDYDHFRYPQMVFVTLDELNLLQDPENAVPSNGQEDRVNFSDSGIQIDLKGISHASRIGICLESDDDYKVVYMHEDQILAEQKKSADSKPTVVMCYFLKVPEKAFRAGYDHLRIFPLDGDNAYGVGHIRLVN